MSDPKLVKIRYKQATGIATDGSKIVNVAEPPELKPFFADKDLSFDISILDQLYLPSDGFGLSLQDIGTVSDVLVKSINFHLKDDFNNADSFSISSENTKKDSVVVSDNNIKTNHKRSNDNVTIADVSYKIRLSNNYKDLLQFNHKLQKYTFKKLNDLVYFTDDSSVGIGTDDNQTAWFNKRAVNFLQFGETIDTVLSSYRKYRSSFQAMDIFAINSGKRYNINIRSSEQLILSNEKTIIVPSMALDANSKHFDKKLLDPVNKQEFLTFNRSFHLYDTFSRQDVVALKTTRPFYDLVGYSDDFVKRVVQNKQDLCNTSDSGFMNNQSYFSENYVQPGYVGQNIQF